MNDLIDELVDAARCLATTDVRGSDWELQHDRQRLAKARAALDAELERMRREVEEARAEIANWLASRVGGQHE